MPSTTVPDIKKALIAAGFEVYRTRGEQVQLADRVRDNLIMDSGVSVQVGDPLTVRFVVRAQRNDFPSEATSSLFDRARALAGTATRRGYVEAKTVVNALSDPADPSRTLDTWYEILFEKAVGYPGEVLDEVRFAMALAKEVPSAPPPGA